MNIRKIAVVGGFAVGAALAFAPLAAAEPTDTLTNVVDHEISSMNSLFTFEATLAGDKADIIAPSATQPFDTIPLADAPQSGTLTPLDYLLYGFNPIAAGPASDPGAYNVFNGALVEFDDALNTELYSLLNNGALIPDSAAATDLFGSSTTIAEALGTGTVQGAVTTFFDTGLADLAAYFDFGSLGSMF